MNSQLNAIQDNRIRPSNQLIIALNVLKYIISHSRLMSRTKRRAKNKFFFSVSDCVYSFSVTKHLRVDPVSRRCCSFEIVQQNSSSRTVLHAHTHKLRSLISFREKKNFFLCNYFGNSDWPPCLSDDHLLIPPNSRRSATLNTVMIIQVDGATS